AGTGEPVAQTSRSGRPDNRDGWKHAASGRNGGGLRNIDGSEKDAEMEVEGSTLMFGARTGIGHAGLCGNNRWRRGSSEAIAAVHDCRGSGKRDGLASAGRWSA